jgi:hypothetical protein
MLTQVTSGMTDTNAQYYGFKSRIINGAMNIDQRNNGASFLTTAGNQYTVDRWGAYVSQASKLTVGQNYGSVGAPVGFNNYLGGFVTSSATVGSTDRFVLYQGIEGYNIADLQYGTANAKTVTLSFWVYSSLTGTFGGALGNASQNYGYPFTYTISSANTWTQISVTIAGPTSGTWGSTNGGGIYVYFGLGVGSSYTNTAGSWYGTTIFGASGATNVISTASATFYLTGVQLEKGTQATSFDYRPYGTELQLCQRYLPVITTNTTTGGYIGVGSADTTSHVYAFLPYQVPPRVVPTGIYSPSISYVSVADFVNASIVASGVSSIFPSETGSLVGFNLVSASATVYRPYGAFFNNASGLLYFTGCEL